MTIQELALSKLSKEIVDDLLNKQIKNANDILMAKNQRIKSHNVVPIKIIDIKPSQQGEDYDNASSNFDANQLLDFKKGNIAIDVIRLETICPIAINKETMEIIDGNHRHFATFAIGEECILTLCCDIENIEK